MYLSKDEEKILSGEEGEAKQLALKLIVRVGEALGAQKLIDIVHAHISGISYDNIGDEGLQLIRDFWEKGGRTSVFSTFNPAGISIGIESPLNTDKEYVKKQLEILKYLKLMGFKESYTCTPYEIREPKPYEHLAWGESSAVAVANTLYNAYTNKEGGPLALASALVGKTYYWGLHLEENRKPNILVKYKASYKLYEPYSGLLGYYIGKTLGDAIPFIDIHFPTKRSIIDYAAAAASTGNIILTKTKNNTVGRDLDFDYIDKIVVDDTEIKQVLDEVSTATIDEVDIFFTGCPHKTFSDLLNLIEKLQILHINRLTKPIWIAVPGTLGRKLKKLTKILVEKNIQVLPGSCLVVSRLRDLVNAVATDSLKTAFYLPRRHRVRVAITTLDEFIKHYGR